MCNVEYELCMPCTRPVLGAIEQSGRTGHQNLDREGGGETVADERKQANYFANIGLKVTWITSDQYTRHFCFFA
jgi:hypothetical protein